MEEFFSYTLAESEVVEKGSIKNYLSIISEAGGLI